MANIPALLDLAFESHDNNPATHNFDLNLSYIQEPVSPLLFENTSPLHQPHHLPFAHFHTPPFFQASQPNFTATLANPESICPKRSKRQPKRKIETQKIGATVECSICLEDIRKSKYFIMQIQRSRHYSANMNSTKSACSAGWTGGRVAHSAASTSADLFSSNVIRVFDLFVYTLFLSVDLSSMWTTIRKFHPIASAP